MAPDGDRTDDDEDEQCGPDGGRLFRVGQLMARHARRTAGLRGGLAADIERG